MAVKLVNPYEKRVNEALARTKEEYAIIKDFEKAVSEKAAYYNQVMNSTLGKLFVVVKAINSILRVFGASLKIKKIDIAQLVEGLFEIKQAQELRNQKIDTYIDSGYQNALNRSIALDGSLDDMFQELTDLKVGVDISARDAFPVIRNLHLISEKIHGTVNSLSADLAAIQGLITVIGSFNDKIDEVIKKVFDKTEEILRLTVDITEAIGAVVVILGIAGTFTNIPPINALAGTLAVVQGYLALILSTVQQLERQVENYAKGIGDFSEISLKLRVMFNKNVMHDMFAEF